MGVYIVIGVRNSIISFTWIVSKHKKNEKFTANGGFHSHWGYPVIAGWFMANLIGIMDDDWGYPYFRNPPYDVGSQKNILGVFNAPSA